jgi:hypothetical protein
MQDFFPTIGNIAKTPLAPFKPLDGITFYDNLLGNLTGQHKNIYCYWPRNYQRKIDLSYVTDYNYKLYDSLNGGNFYNIRTDVYEKSPIPDSQLTPDEKKLKNQWKKILRQGYQ